MGRGGSEVLMEVYNMGLRVIRARNRCDFCLFMPLHHTGVWCVPELGMRVSHLTTRGRTRLKSQPTLKPSNPSSLIT